MAPELVAYAEFKAREAEPLAAFSGINLLHIKREIGHLLALIGREGLFDEYTKHDISHIDSMLAATDWLVPSETKEIMSAADWLFIVLAIYFHDLGMLVTREEFRERSNSGFPAFVETELFAGDDGANYQARIRELPEEKVDRFLYQEFVRHRHAERIKNWILGRAPEHLGISHQAMAEVDALLRNLKPQIRRDLALVCESHHLGDLHDLSKYRVYQPYGNSDNEAVNLQYAAILLRTSDLLHITSDRTPSIVFRTINPADPISQMEWAKQMAVTRVRPSLGRDREGRPDETALQDTVEVHAYFTDPEGFFGLTSYLTYAASEFKKGNDWSRQANDLAGAKHKFPWRYIDDSHIETEGFLRQTFEFTLDQQKILDLLTGHTLYNDTRVVLRELIQNGLDAVRLQALIDDGDPSNSGLVEVIWNEAARTLQVKDNGTGMTQAIIENHLLKVGSSRYQDPEFRKSYPGFSPISRFGIGLLSVFMIADEVEIVTSHASEGQARHLSLRSVNGRYLIRLLDKLLDPLAKEIGSHGTMVSLRVRPRAVIKDILDTVKFWVVIPGARVIVRSNEDKPSQVGFSSPADALRATLEDLGYAVDGTQIKIEERSVMGLALAYALSWSKYFKEWTFLQVRDDSPRYYLESGEFRDFEEGAESKVRLGTCIEGIRVEATTPGFSGRIIAAIANATGVDAPKTNVARSGIELTPQRDQLLRNIYQIYCGHVIEEVDNLHSERDFSITWAAQESAIILAPLTGGGPSGQAQALNRRLLNDAIKEIPAILIEKDATREIVSANKLEEEGALWTIDCALFRSAELLMREARGSGSLSRLIQSISPSEAIEIPREPVVCGFGDRYVMDAYVTGKREVDKIKVNSAQRRVDLRWVRRGENPMWLPLAISREFNAWLGARLSRTYAEKLLQTAVFFPLGRIKVEGISTEIAVNAFRASYIVPDTEFAKRCAPLVDRKKVEPLVIEKDLKFGIIVIMLKAIVSNVVGKKNLREMMDEIMSRGTIDTYTRDTIAELVEEDWPVFDPSVWRREKG